MSHIINNVNSKQLFKKGDVYYAELDGVGSEQIGIRPVVIVQNDIGNQFSPTVIVVATTSQYTNAKFPTQVSISKGEGGLPKDSIVLTEQIRTIDKSRLVSKIGHLPLSKKQMINDALLLSLDLWEFI